MHLCRRCPGNFVKVLDEHDDDEEGSNDEASDAPSSRPCSI